ncbi:MAG: addiction module toxin RelE [archaeon]
MYEVIISEGLYNPMRKLEKKNPKRLMIIRNKISEVVENPHHYKNLRKPMQKYKAVHVDTSFVLIFSVDDNEKTVTFVKYEHHDKVYN